MLTRNIKNPDKQKLCHILINHYPNLTYSIGDFEKGKLIYEEGKIATHNNLDKLADLADKLKDFEQRKPKVPEIENFLVLDTVIYTAISDGNLELVKSRTNINANKKYTTTDLVKRINRAMGTTLFRQIIYNHLVIEDKIGLQLNGFEHSKHQIKGSLYFDTYRGVGLIANYTGRNIIGKSTRLFVSLDIAEQPKFRVQYQKNFGS
jgi:NTE family protein